MVNSATPERKPPKKPKLPSIPWYYVTRFLGTVILVFGVFGDSSGDRGTLIITGAGLLGIDKVARSDGPPSS